MCLPMLAAAGPLQILSGAVSAMGAIAQANEQNKAAAANAQSANLAAQTKYDDLGRRYVYNARATQQEGYKAVMEAREAAGTAVASAGSSGVSGVSIGNILASVRQEGAENMSRVRTKQDDLKDSYLSDVKTVESEARGRIASVRPANGLNLGLGVISGFIPRNTTQG